MEFSRWTGLKIRNQVEVPELRLVDLGLLRGHASGNVEVNSSTQPAGSIVECPDATVEWRGDADVGPVGRRPGQPDHSPPRSAEARDSQLPPRSSQSSSASLRRRSGAPPR